MQQSFFQMALVVKEYDEAITFYTQKLKFELLEDTPLSPTKRWVRVAPKGNSGASILLARAKNKEEASRIGNQTGGRVFLFMHTDNLNRDYEHLKKENIQIVREPSTHEYGKVLVFADLYGNLWDLIEPISPNSPS